jgi:hypothetical protein
MAKKPLMVQEEWVKSPTPLPSYQRQLRTSYEELVANVKQKES